MLDHKKLGEAAALDCELAMRQGAGFSDPDAGRAWEKERAARLAARGRSASSSVILKIVDQTIEVESAQAVPVDAEAFHLTVQHPENAITRLVIRVDRVEGLDEGDHHAL